VAADGSAKRTGAATAVAVKRWLIDLSALGDGARHGSVGKGLAMLIRPDRSAHRTALARSTVVDMQWAVAA
jgi:hypothetical protein